jgi:hypothetical protein
MVLGEPNVDAVVAHVVTEPVRASLAAQRWDGHRVVPADESERFSLSLSSLGTVAGGDRSRETAPTLAGLHV